MQSRVIRVPLQRRSNQSTPGIKVQRQSFSFKGCVRIEPVFAMSSCPKYNARTPDITLRSALAVVRNSPSGLIKTKRKIENVDVTYRPCSCWRPRYWVVLDCNRSGKRGWRMRPRLVARPVGRVPEYAIHRPPSKWGVPGGISGGR